MEVLNTVNPYNSDDFAGFTSGIKKKASLNRSFEKLLAKMKVKLKMKKRF